MFMQSPNLIITTNSNDLVADIHDRMPVILAPADYARRPKSREPSPGSELAPRERVLSE
jgi:putative SOS response-associated peptidase YedK